MRIRDMLKRTYKLKNPGEFYWFIAEKGKNILFESWPLVAQPQLHWTCQHSSPWPPRLQCPHCPNPQNPCVGHNKARGEQEVTCQHLGLVLIRCISTLASTSSLFPDGAWAQPVFQAFKVAFLKIPRGQEWTHLSSMQSSATNSLACCSTANSFAKTEMATEQNGLVFINWPTSPPTWRGEGRALVCAGPHSPCGREMRPGFVYQPLMRKVWVLRSLGSIPAWTCRDKAGGWASLPSSFTLGCRQIRRHSLYGGGGIPYLPPELLVEVAAGRSQRNLFQDIPVCLPRIWEEPRLIT